MFNPKTRVIVGLSGGVDSAVSALLLDQQGFDVQGLFMKNWDGDDSENYCPAAQDFMDAKDVCEELEIPLHKANFARDYWDRVFKHFLDEYRAGRTPNPDILCNKEIKFDVFMLRAQALGAHRIATGHYARIIERDGRYHLYKALDRNKDQSYFLHALNQEQLANAIFPLGELEKGQVRKMAAAANLINHDKKDSTGICFVGERDFNEFLSRYLPAQPGDIQTPDGHTLGRHNGLMYHTLGQRRGIGIGGRQDSTGEPWFVVGKKLKENVLVVAQGHDHPLLFSNTLHAINLNWITGTPPSAPFRCAAKTRYRQPDQACVITQIDEHGCTVEFDQPQRAVTPGQSVVFYDGDECLGGGVIDKVEGIIYQ